MDRPVSKEEIRMRVWRMMEERGISAPPKPAYHSIPNFAGAVRAAQNLRGLPEYQRAKTIF